MFRRCVEGPRRILSLRVLKKNSDILVVQTFQCSPVPSMGEAELGPRAPRRHHCTQSLVLLLQFPGRFVCFADSTQDFSVC